MPGWKDRAVKDSGSSWKDRAQGETAPAAPEESAEEKWKKREEAPWSYALEHSPLNPVNIYNTLSHVKDYIPIASPAINQGAASTAEYLVGKGDDKVKQDALARMSVEREKFEQQNPGSAAAAQVIGAGVVPTPFSATKGVIGAASRIGGNAGLAYADEALRDGRPKDAAKIAGGTTALVEGALAAAKVPKALRSLAEARTVKAVTGNNSRAINELVSSGKLQLEDDGGLSSTLGRTLLSKDEAGPSVITPLAKSSDIAPAVEAKRKFYGEKIGALGQKIDEFHPQAVSGKEIAAKIRQRASEIPDLPSTQPLRDRLEKEALGYEAKGGFRFDEGQKYKDEYNWNALTPEPEKNFANILKSSVGKEMEDAVGRTSKSAVDSGRTDLAKLLDEYKESKSKYGDYASASKYSKSDVAKELKNRFISPSDIAIGGVVGLGSAVNDIAQGRDPTTSLATGLAASAGNKFMRQRGSALTAKTADTLAKVLQSNPQSFGKFREILEAASRKGNQNLALTHYLLMKNPEYQKTIEQGSAP